MLQGKFGQHGRYQRKLRGRHPAVVLPLVLAVTGALMHKASELAAEVTAALDKMRVCNQLDNRIQLIDVVFIHKHLYPRRNPAFNKQLDRSQYFVIRAPSAGEVVGRLLPAEQGQLRALHSQPFQPVDVAIIAHGSPDADQLEMLLARVRQPPAKLPPLAVVVAVIGLAIPVVYSETGGVRPEARGDIA